jgi:hypothetical protein
LEAYFYFLQFAISVLLGNSHSSAAVAALPRSLVQSIVFGLAMLVGESLHVIHPSIHALVTRYLLF